jgi:riboflavin kinase/FMN adenylyltransferase
MKLLKHSEEFREHGSESVVTIGVFDGIHLGHQAIIRDCVREAEKKKIPSVALTFERNPRELVCGESPCIITAPRRKLEILSGLGLDFTISMRFSRRFAAMSPHDFCSDLLVGQLGAVEVCVGENFHFGAGGQGDVRTLRSRGADLGFKVHTVPLVQLDELGQLSSTLIRGLITEGRAHDVMRALGRPYAVTGRVVKGHHRGKRLGFPTANIAMDRDFCVPPDGVYAGKARLGRAHYLCAINIGSNPTFGDGETALEVFLLDFSGDIYGESLEVEFHHRLRDEKAFVGEKDLVRQMERDVEKARTLLQEGVSDTH